jgi:hypothetical protein
MVQSIAKRNENRLCLIAVCRLNLRTRSHWDILSESLW